MFDYAKINFGTLISIFDCGKAQPVRPVVD